MSPLLHAIHALLSDTHASCVARHRLPLHTHAWPGAALLALLAPVATPQAQALYCPTAVSANTLPVTRVTDALNTPITLNADGVAADLQDQGWMTLDGSQGRVELRQGDRVISTDALRYRPATREAVASGTVTLEDSTLQLTGSNATLNSDGGAQLQRAGFLLKNSGGRGSAQQIALSSEHNLSLDDVRYTTCQESTPAWQLKLSDLDINERTRTGTGRNVRLELKGIPVFYTPWISFPVSNERRSGFLFPSFGGSSRSGQSLSVPWYWNIAPNYDTTFTPIIDSARGFRLDNEFRYLGTQSEATLLTGYLPRDNKTHEWRGMASLKYVNDLSDVLRLNLRGTTVRETRWYEDFGASRDDTSQVYLTRALTLTAQTTHWRSELLLQNLQTLDASVALSDRPYTQLPRLSVTGEQALPLNLQFDLDAELAYFTRGDVLDDNGDLTPSTTGARLVANPTLSLPLRRTGMYLIPSVAWRHTQYDLKNATSADSTPSLSAPVYSVDAGLVFERSGGQQQQRLYTLEPRLLYLNVPYRDQSDLPLFDTGMPDFSLVQLFSTRRFIGPDRLGDTHQLSIGVTTRMLNSADGSQYLSGTLGQAIYFRDPCVTSLTQTTCAAAQTAARSSDLIGELSLTAYKNFSINLGLQWDQNQQRSERGDAFVQYRADNDHILNVGYRYDRNSVDQWETSFAWKIASAWSGYGRAVYSRLDGKLLDRFVGLEYRSCCFNVRAVVGRAVTTRTGEFATQYKLQLELKGLSSVGTADTFLQSSIAGYSARD